MSYWGMTWRTGRTCKLGATRAGPKQKQKFDYTLLDRRRIELGRDALAGFDRFLQVCDRVYFPCSAPENVFSFVHPVAFLDFCIQFKQHRHLDVTIVP
jgi:hypothetical protein